jgi:hypothetical protein
MPKLNPCPFCPSFPCDNMIIEGMTIGEARKTCASGVQDLTILEDLSDPNIILIEAAAIDELMDFFCNDDGTDKDNLPQA